MLIHIDAKPVLFDSSGIRKWTCFFSMLAETNQLLTLSYFANEITRMFGCLFKFKPAYFSEIK